MKKILTILVIFSWLELQAQSFTESVNPDLIGVDLSASATADFDNDGFVDILITGLASNSVTDFYFGNSDGSFTQVNMSSITGVYSPRLAIGDMNNDGLMDALMSGTGDDGLPKTFLLKNDGSRAFTEITPGLENVDAGTDGNIEMRDFDNDGDLDILLSGFYINPSNAYQEITKIYRNDGSDSFTDLGDYYGRSSAFGDYDNDGDLDLVSNGAQGLKISENLGDGTFADPISTSINMLGGNFVWIDYNNDGIQELLASGRIDNDYYTGILENTGDISTAFSKNTSQDFETMQNGRFELNDYNQDGYIDILLEV